MLNSYIVSMVFIIGEGIHAHMLSAFSCVWLCVAVWIVATHPTPCPGSSVHGDSPGKNIGMDCHALLQGIFSTQGINPHVLCLLHWQAGSSSPRAGIIKAKTASIALNWRSSIYPSWSSFSSSLCIRNLICRDCNKCPKIHSLII